MSQSQSGRSVSLTRLPVVGTVGRHPAVYLMGREAIPSRRGFSRGAMRHPGVSGITRPFGRLSRGRGQVLHVLLSRSPLASTRRWVPFDLHVLGAPPAFILSQDRTLRPNMLGFEPVRSSQLLADRFRSIHMVLYRKRNFSGPPLGGLAKNKSKLDHFKWFDVCPDATLNVSILAVSGSQGARCAADPGPTGPRGKEIYCQTGGAPGAGIWAYTFPTQFWIRLTFASR